jgi:1,4-alpha-glucan branching enzyme
VQAEEIPTHGRPFSLNLTLPPLAALFFKAGG